MSNLFSEPYCYSTLSPFPPPEHMEAYFVWALDIGTHIINVNEIYGSICELKCTFGFE